MPKYCFIFLTSILFVKTAVAQKDTAVYYLTVAGKQVLTKEQGDLIVKIFPFSGSGNPKLYVVDGYYRNGEKLFHTTSLNASFPLQLQGVYTTFFQSGNKMSERNFDHGEIMGDQTLYYPNGKLYDVLSKEITPTDTLVLFKECRDSTGTVLTTNGNGFWIIYNDDFSRIIEKGKVVNGLQDSVWTAIARGDISYTIRFKNGKKVLDTSSDKIFTSVEVVPEFPGGLDAFMHYLANRCKYPAIARENQIQGRVIVTFVVEKDGTLTNVTVTHGIGGGCDEEAMRVIKMSPRWHAGMQNGKPVRVQYSVPISFSLDGNTMTIR